MRGRVSPEEEESLDENTAHVHRFVHELLHARATNAYLLIIKAMKHL